MEISAISSRNYWFDGRCPFPYSSRWLSLWFNGVGKRRLKGPQNASGRMYDRPKNENLQVQYSFFLRGFISAMAESPVTSPSDANLDFDDDTLKGKYTKNIKI